MGRSLTESLTAGTIITLVILGAVYLSPLQRSGGNDPLKPGEPELTWRGFLPPPDLPAMEERYRQLIDYSNVAVLRNVNSPEAMEIADRFIALRDVPPQNVCNLTLTTAETISRTTFDLLRADVEACLIGQGIATSVDYLVTTRGFPLRVADVTDKSASVDSELALILGPNSGWINQTWWLANPYFGGSGPFSRSTFGFYLVTRLTGYDASESKDLLDLATMGIGRKGQFVFDIDPTKTGGYAIGNTWMSDAKDLLVAKGFDVFLDQNSSFVTGRDRVAGYTSWGSNDATWYLTAVANGGFETDADLDGVADNWTEVEVGGGTVSLNTIDPRTGTNSVQIARPGADGNLTAITQDFFPLTDTRYYAYGYANYSGVSPEEGVILRIEAVDASDQVIQVTNSSVRTGTSGGWVSLGQVIYEPPQGATKLRLSGVLSQSAGNVNFDDFGIIPIRPHFNWIPGALAETYVSTGGRSFAYGTGYGQSLVADLVRDGAAGTKGYVFEPYLNAVAHPDLLFDRLTDGYTLGESYSIASEIHLGWMDIILGDPKYAPYNLAYVPDLEVSAANVTVSPTPAVSGVLVNVSFAVTNLGNYAAPNATVSVYLGNPMTGGTLLRDFTISVDYDASASLSFVWDSLGFSGSELCVQADTPDDFYEVSESNNLACVPFSLAPSLALPLVEGKNFLSLPLVQQNTSISWVLRTIAGDYDRITLFTASDASDPWKVYAPARGRFELTTLDHTQGFWINITKPGGTTLLLGGTYPSVTPIILLPGWNMVGFPAGSDRTVAAAFAGISWTRVETFDPLTRPYLLQELSAGDLMEPGKGIWVYVMTTEVWTVPY